MLTRNILWLSVLLLTLAVATPAVSQPKSAKVAFETRQGKLLIRIAGRPFAEYVPDDNKTTRPYFANVHAPNGMQVTRNHPPRAGDAKDHATMHPGIWLAFGDLSGNDDWRNKTRVRTEMDGKPKGGLRRGTFTVRNAYVARNGKQVVCEELCTYTILARPAGYLLISDSQFQSKHGDFYFGDQEEMGFGVRVATSMSVNAKGGGRILDSEGRKNGRGIWGKSAKWCDYSGPVNGKTLGILSMPDPKNFRPCWWHARDYGLLLANPFGRKALTRGPTSKVVVKHGETFRLRFAVLLHAEVEPTATFLERAYQDYVRVVNLSKKQ